MPRQAKNSPNRWLHPAFRDVYCFNRSGMVYTVVQSKKQSTGLTWTAQNKMRAMRILEERREKSITGARLSKNQTIFEALPLFLEIHVSKLDNRTKIHYKEAIKKFFDKDYPLSAFDDIKSMILRNLNRLIHGNAKEAGLKPSSINTYLSKINSFFSYLLDEGIIDRNPVSKKMRIPFDKNKVIVISTEDEIKIKKYFAEHSRRDFQIALDIAFLTGMRREEIRSIKKEDIKKDCLLIHGKGKKIRYFPFFLAPELEKLLNEFVNLPVRFQADSISLLFKNAIKALNLDKRLTFHSTRKTVASRWQMAGMNDEDRTSLLGHNIEIERQVYLADHDMNYYRARLGDFARNLNNLNEYQ